MMACYADVRCALIVGHAQHSGSSAEAIDGFWEQLRSLLGSLGGTISPIIFLDANARFDENARGDWCPANRNASHLCQTLHDFGLDRTRHRDCYGRRVTTWQSPMKHRTKIDYVLAPDAWAPCFVTKGLPATVDEMLLAWDHWPLQASIELNIVDVKERRLKVDRKAIRDPRNATKLKGNFWRSASGTMDCWS